MRIGLHRTPIIIEQQSTALVGPGDQQQTWTTFLSTWASMAPKSGKQTINSEAIKNESVYTFNIRYTPGVTARMRVKLVDNRQGITRYFDILTPPQDPDGRGRELTFDAVEGGADG